MALVCLWIVRLAHSRPLNVALGVPAGVAVFYAGASFLGWRDWRKPVT